MILYSLAGSECRSGRKGMVFIELPPFPKSSTGLGMSAPLNREGTPVGLPEEHLCGLRDILETCGGQGQGQGQGSMSLGKQIHRALGSSGLSSS